MALPTNQAYIASSGRSSSSWVEPAGLVQPALIKCSALDNLVAPVYPSPTLFFRLSPDADTRQIYQDCKRGLARYLYQHPHLCGRISKDDTGRNSIHIPPSPHAGANFEYRDHRDARDMPSFDEFRDSGWPIADGEQDGLSVLRPENFPHSDHGDPIIVPQFNVVRGGIILTLSIAHAIGDLVQFMDFVGNFARNTRAVAEARVNGQPEPALPHQVADHLMDRSHFMPNVQIEHNLDKLAVRAASIPHMTFLDPRGPEKMAEVLQGIFTKARLTDRDLARFSESELRELSCGVWSFSPSAVQAIKAAAQRTAAPGVKLSSIDCLTAFNWQRFFAAKWAPHDAGPEPVPKTSRIVFAGSIRQRLARPLPLDYMPTCVDLFPVTIQADGFTSAAPESLAKAAVLVRGSNTGWSEDLFREKLEIAGMHPMNPGLVPSGPIDALVTDHTRSSPYAYENWGPDLGQCEHLREPYLGRAPPHGELTLLPRCRDGSIEVMVAAEAVVMQRLRDDQYMRAMATCQFVMGDFIRSTANKRRHTTSKL